MLTHEDKELLAKKGEYYQLYKMQQKWYVE